MKTRIIRIILTLLIVITLSCEKERQTGPYFQGQDEAMGRTEMDQYLLDFLDRMDNQLKSGEMLNLEDARWHLSATLNFSYADAKSGYEIFPTDTLAFILPLVNGQVGMSDFSTAFYQVTSFLSERYLTIEADDKTLILVSVSITDQAEDEAELTAVAMMGYSSGLSWGYPFSEGHWWYWGYGLGRCGPYEGENIGSDGAKRLTFAANLTVPVPGPGRVYWTDEVTVWVLPHEHPDPNSPCGYKLLFSEIPWQQQPYCISPSEMDYYHENIVSFGQQFKPAGKILMGYFVQGTIFMYSNLSFPAHILQINYGVPNVTPFPPNEL
jgi:hypothetical protein